MNGFSHNALWPVSADCRPKPRRKVVTEVDVNSDVLRAYPRVVHELNLCCADVWCGEGRPGRGWNGWEVELVPLAIAVALPCGGEA